MDSSLEDCETTGHPQGTATVLEATLGAQIESSPEAPAKESADATMRNPAHERAGHFEGASA